MSVTQPDTDNCIQEFFQWNLANCSKGTLGPISKVDVPFLADPQVKSYFNVPRVIGILTAVLQDRAHTVDPGLVSDKYGKVLAILLLVGKARFIDHFVQHDIRDEKLPLGKQRPEGFPVDTGDALFFERFCEAQWRFCVPVFQKNMRRHFESQRILPIVRKEVMEESTTAVVYKITLHQAYNELHNSSSKAIKQSNQDRNIFVLKTYRHPRAQQYFEMERDAFQRIGSATQHGMIGFYGSFVQDGNHNILLEYADFGNLEQYFQQVSPPDTFEDLLSFWKELFKVIDALKRIHNVTGNDAPGPGIFQGWHQDVKPSNILVKSYDGRSPYHVRFKLTDLGLSHFRKNVAGEEPADADSSGTRTYGAPECSSPGSNVTRSIDIWSLGCIFSEAATWSVFGVKKLQEYRMARRAEVWKMSLGLKNEDCFHDGSKALEAVGKMHDTLIKGARRFDTLTKQLIDLMLKGMFYYSPPECPSAPYLVRISDQVILSAQEISRSLNRDYQSDVMSGMFWNASTLQPPPEMPTSLPNISFRRSPSTTAQSRSFTTGAHPKEISPTETSSMTANHFQQRVPVATPANDNADNHKWPASSPKMVTHSLAGFGSPQESNDLSMAYLPPAGSPGTNSIGQSFPKNRPNSAPIVPEISPTLGVRRSISKSDRHFSVEAYNRGIEKGGLPSKNEKRTSVTYTDSDHSRGTHRHPATPLQIRANGDPFPTSHNESQAQRKHGRRPQPSMTVAEGLKWKNDTKNNVQNTSLPSGEFINELNGRDHLFIVDDSESMAHHWDSVKRVFGLLVYMLKKKDPDGIELYLTSSSKRYKSKKTKTLMKTLEDKANFRGLTKVTSRLNSVFQGYQEKLDRQTRSRVVSRSLRSRVRPLSTYVLTDGNWQPQDDAGDLIENLVSMLQERRKNKYQVGIQFIQFGDDAEATRRLEHLDTGLDLQKWDIVDHESADGNVWKMLLGATNKWFDGDQDQDQDHDHDQDQDQDQDDRVSQKYGYPSSDFKIYEE